MDTLFLKVLNMSISASWLVLIVLALRLLLKKSPKWIHVALWALVAVRLICPVSIESVLSLIPEKTTEQMVQSISGSYYGDAMIYSQGSENYEAAVSAGIVPNVGDNGYHYVITQADDVTKPVQTVAVLYGRIWLGGILLMLLHALISYFRMKRKVSASIDIGNGVHICDYIDTPFILGILRPKIYLPSSMEPDSASHVLAHERAHIARKDHWWKPFGYLLLSVYWFNPLLWLAYILLCRDIELACDEKVIRDMEVPEKKAYSEALLSCSVNRRMIAACPLAFGEVGVKERVKTVLNYKKPAFWIVILAVLALIVTAVCFLTDPVTAGEPFGKIYQVEKVVYQNPVLSYYMTESDAPLFQLAEDGELLIQQEPDKWESRGLFTEMDMAEANPADWFFGEELGWEGEEAFQTVLGNIQTAWIAELPDPQRPGYTRVCLLLRNNGALYLGDGYDAGNGPEINWFYRLKDTGLNADENRETPFGSHYRVEDTIYLERGVGSYSPSDRFVYSLTTGRGFVEKERMSESGRNLARFTPAELTQEKLAARMNDEALARELLANNEMAWEYSGFEGYGVQIETFLYLLQQRDGQILLVTGNNRTGEFRIGYIFRLEKILSDDPFAESRSPYQWTRNIKLDYVQSITVSTHDTDGNRLQTELEDFDRYGFLSVLNGVDEEEITFGKLAGEPYIWAEIVCEGETVELAYDKDAVRITFPESATGRYPGEAGNTWIITNDALVSAMYAYNAYSFEDSPFSQPDNAYHWCQRMNYSLTDAFTMASEYVTVENRYEQAYALLLSRAEIESLLALLKDIPESAFAQAEYPEESSRSIYIQCRDVWSGRSPFVQLHLKDGVVYYTYNSTPEETHQTWKIDSEELAAFISAYFTGDFTGWDQFAPVPYVVGEVTLEAEGAVLVLPKMEAFEHEISEDGIRFKPGDEDGWIRMQFLTEPFVAKCGTGLKTQTGNYDGMEIVRGYYDDAAYWSFVEGTIESDGTKYYLHILNENGASWVEEYDWEINWMIGEWDFRLTD